jgi:adenylosuccinate synthase
VNGLTEVFLTKLDVLSGFERVKVCTAYRAGDAEYDDFPPHQSLFHAARPVYEEVDGWEEDLTEARSFDALPKSAQAYVEHLQDLGGVRVSAVSVGPSREQTLVLA